VTQRTYLTFLGRGSRDPATGKYDYVPMRYCIDGGVAASSVTKFVQCAEIELLGPENFDKILVVCTQQSHADHFSTLAAELSHLGAVEPLSVMISEDMGATQQWDWFEKILPVVEPGALLTVDLTHGYRAGSIVLSAAIHFLVRAKKAMLAAVYYGRVDGKKGEDQRGVIVDLKDFYRINDWADAVSRLVEEADARKLAEVAEAAPDFQAGGLIDPALRQALLDLTSAVRNVEVNRVATLAREAMARVHAAMAGAPVTTKVLLDLVAYKFASLASEAPTSGRYDSDYLQMQVEIARLLIEHKLYMQAFTVMRELIGSIGMSGVPHKEMNSSRGRGQRRRADVFICMAQIDRSDWRFKFEDEELVQMLLPWYEKLVSAGIADNVRDLSRTLVKIRNGFDHAWTSSASAPMDLEEASRNAVAKLSAIVATVIAITGTHDRG